MMEVSVRDGRKVRRGTFDGKSSDQLDSCWSKRRKMSRRQFSTVRPTARPVYSPHAGAGGRQDLARKSTSESAAARLPNTEFSTQRPTQTPECPGRAIRTT